MKYIPLSQNKHAIVDDEDFQWLNQWKWSYHIDKKGNEAAHRGVYNPEDKKQNMSLCTV